MRYRCQMETLSSLVQNNTLRTTYSVPAPSSSMSKVKVLATYSGSDRATLPDKPAGAVRIVCQSDTHSKLEQAYADGKVSTIPNGDVYIHSGDFSSHGLFKETLQFHDFVAKLPHATKIIIAGNHDITMDTAYYVARGRDRFHPRKPQDHVACKRLFTHSQDCIYLEDSGISLFEGRLNVWGSPWQPEFFDWGFNLPRGTPIREKWDRIPDNTDILITHGPPAGQGDRCMHGQRAGCEELLKAVDRVNPALHVFGHIHEDYGISTRKSTTFVNASTCTLAYRPTNASCVIDIHLPGKDDDGEEDVNQVVGEWEGNTWTRQGA